MNHTREHIEHKYFDILDNADNNYFSPAICALNSVITLDHKLVFERGCGSGKYIF
ncbi:MAG: hypothetical protein HOE45_03520 [Gammaproteobacteria bacterium]|jgi:hypothetical protein|nr:hypothetical protein [Gammaproteobacteria bacterium]